MCYGRMKHRVPSLKFHDVGRLDGYRFVINKVSKDGSAKGNIEKADSDRVFGAIYSLDVADVTALDEAEGVGDGYVVKEELDVRSHSGQSVEKPVRVYVA